MTDWKSHERELRALEADTVSRAEHELALKAANAISASRLVSIEALQSKLTALQAAHESAKLLLQGQAKRIDELLSHLRQQQAELATERARAEEAERARSTLHDDYWSRVRQCDVLESQLAAANARVARLEGSLRDIADAADGVLSRKHRTYITGRARLRSMVDAARAVLSTAPQASTEQASPSPAVDICDGCDTHVSECGPALWAQQRKCCPDCTHVAQPAPSPAVGEDDWSKVEAGPFNAPEDSLAAQPAPGGTGLTRAEADEKLAEVLGSQAIHLAQAVGSCERTERNEFMELDPLALFDAALMRIDHLSSEGETGDAFDSVVEALQILRELHVKAADPTPAEPPPVDYVTRAELEKLATDVIAALRVAGGLPGDGSSNKPMLRTAAAELEKARGR